MQVQQLLQKKFIIIAVILLIAISSLIGFFVYINSQQILTVTYDSSKYSSVTLYKGTDSAYEKTIAPTNTIAIKNISSGKEYKLPKGSYYLIASGDNSVISKVFQGVRLESDVKKISLDYTYTDYYLEKLSAQEKSSIDSTIFASNQKIASYYNIQEESVKEKGKIAVAALVFKGSGSDLNRDTLKVILKKDNSTWKVLCGPKITLDTYSCSAPQDIMDKINNIEIANTPLMPNYNLDTSQYTTDI